MKYLMRYLIILAAFAYLVSERLIKIIICVIVLLWNLSFDKKYYQFWNGVFLIYPSPQFFDTTKEYFDKVRYEINQNEL